MKVSVVVPAYNAERFIGQCLESICAQTLTDIEIIVVDDGSTDATLSLIHEWVSRDSRVKVLTQENSYAGTARNKGLSIAKGEYLAFLDADDFFEPDMLALMYDRASKTQADVVVCRSSYYNNATHEIRPIDAGIRYVDTDGVFSGTELSKVMFRFCVGWPWDKLFRRAFVEEHALRFQDLRTTNDAFFVFMSLILASRISFVDSCLAYHRTNNIDSLEFTRNRSWESACKAIDAIEQGLRSAGLYEAFEQSFLNWALNFSLWNYFTLDGEAKNGLLNWMGGALAEKLPCDLDDFFFLEEDRRSAEFLRKDRMSLLDWCIKGRRDIEYLTGEVDRLREVSEREIGWRDAELAEKRALVDSQRQELDSIKASKSYRAAVRISRMLHPFG